jgi:hypothetical protein
MAKQLIPEAKRPMAWRIFIEGMNLADSGILDCRGKSGQIGPCVRLGA